MNSKLMLSELSEFELSGFYCDRTAYKNILSELHNRVYVQTAVPSITAL